VVQAKSDYLALTMKNNENNNENTKTSAADCERCVSQQPPGGHFHAPYSITFRQLSKAFHL
jgi:hypothetical protein